MLPPKLFDQLTQALNIRTDQRGSEKRTATRIHASIPAQLFPVTAGVAVSSINVRVKDISSSGIGVLVATKAELPAEVLIKLSPRNREADYLWCLVQRKVNLDGICRLYGCAFSKLLQPGQTVTAGTKLNALKWIDVGGDAIPDDPRESAKEKQERLKPAKAA